MLMRALPVVLLAGALLADGGGYERAAFYLLVAAVPAAAFAALSVFGELVELPGRPRLRLDVGLAAVGLLCVVVAASSRGQAPEAALAGSAAVAALAVYGAQTLAALARR
jgi:hypothetical protein